MAGVSVPDVGVSTAEPLPDVAGVSPPGVTPVVGLLPLVEVAELSGRVMVLAAAWDGFNATLIPKTVTPSRTEATPTFNFRRP